VSLNIYALFPFRQNPEQTNHTFAEEIDQAKAEAFSQNLMSIINHASVALDGAGLGTVWGEELAVEMLGEAGFKQIDVRQHEHDIMNNFYIAKKN